MRVSLASIGFLFITATANAQTPCGSAVLNYDPYKPSDLAIVRQYGGTLMSQVPLSTLMKLDPYVPSQGELLRQVGNGIPVWVGHPWLSHAPVPAAVDCTPKVDRAPAAAELSQAAYLTRFADVLRTVERQGAPKGLVVTSPTSAGVSPKGDSGVWIQFGDRTWVSSGSAVPFRDSDFTQVGSSAGVAVYRRAGAADDVIYIQSTRGMVAPFRATQK
jgi:hypothetical protein